MSREAAVKAVHRLAAATVLALLAVGLAGALDAPLDATSTQRTEPAWQIRIGVAQAPAQHVWEPAALAAYLAQAPPLPTIQDGLGPGSALQQDGSSICTAAFLLRDPYTGVYYLSTAGHCLVKDSNDPAPYTGAANPEKMVSSVAICVAQCLNNALGLGEYVTVAKRDGVSPIVFAQSGGVGKDFGIIQLPGDFHQYLRPEMPMWGGPDAMASSADSSQFVVHFGHGNICCNGVGAVVTHTPADQGRVGVYQGNNGNAWDAAGVSSGGDSGSGVSLGVAGADIMAGGKALGVLTHGSYLVHPVVSIPIFTGTMLSHGLDMVRGSTGLSLQLVPAGDPLPAGPTDTPPPVVPSNITVTAPQANAVIDPAVKKVTVKGLADRGGGALANGTQVQVAIDDLAFGVNSRVPIAGNASWSGTWDLAGVPNGKHTVRARLVDKDGAVLDQQNVTVTLQKGGSSSGSSSSSKSGTGGTSSTKGNAGGAGSNADPDDGDGEAAAESGGGPLGMPGPAPWLAVAAVLAVAVVVRRRVRS